MSSRHVSRARFAAAAAVSMAKNLCASGPHCRRFLPTLKQGGHGSMCKHEDDLARIRWNLAQIWHHHRRICP
jgi:hypothetical protein